MDTGCFETMGACVRLHVIAQLVQTISSRRTALSGERGGDGTTWGATHRSGEASGGSGTPSVESEGSEDKGGK